jgi:hypothetical protein
LALFINNLNQNDSEYAKYLKFKKKGGVRNKILLDLMEKRKWGIHNDRIKGMNFRYRDTVSALTLTLIFTFR